jgi:hypothetical protein
VTRRFVGKRSGGPWFGDDKARILFEANALKYLPGLSAETIHHGLLGRRGRRYVASLAVPHYGSRQIEILFQVDSPNLPRVTVDGPTESPHRSDGCLCMWLPRDADSAKWVLRDGLLALLGTTTAHLFREAWWRETGEWLGPEFNHEGRVKDLAG